MPNSHLNLNTNERTMPRRRFLQLLTMGPVAAISVPDITKLRLEKINNIPRSLAFHNLHTEEKVKLTYFESGKYVTGALSEINHVLRDHRSNTAHPMDPNLLNLLYNLQQRLDVNKPFSVISGYRSPATNELLRNNSNGVAKRSQHMLGKAIDIRIEGVNTRHIRKAAIAMQQGGVGYYSRSNFLHLDTASIRNW